MSRKINASDIQAALLLLLAAVVVGIAMCTRIPTREELTEVHGVLASYRTRVREERRRHRLLGPESKVVYPTRTILHLENGISVWTETLGVEQARGLLSAPRVLIRSFIDEQSEARPIEDAVKAYGLWVDGREIRPVEADLEADQLQWRWALSVIGLAPLAMFLLSGGWPRSR